MTDDNQTNGVRITTRELYTELVRQGKILQRLADSLPDTDTKVDDHEIRIRKLEQKAGWIFGALGLMGALLGVVSVSVG
jgi:flagellar motor component MotA